MARDGRVLSPEEQWAALWFWPQAVANAQLLGNRGLDEEPWLTIRVCLELLQARGDVRAQVMARVLDTEAHGLPFIAAECERHHLIDRLSVLLGEEHLDNVSTYTEVRRPDGTRMPMKKLREDAP